MKEFLEVLSGDATHLKVELYYNKGGVNYFTGSNERRGLYLSVTPVTRTKHEGGGVSERYVGFTGVKRLIVEMKRFNQKTLDTCVVDEQYKTSLIKHVCESNNIVLKDLEVQK